MEDLGFGYTSTHRQKRTHSQMEHDRSSSPPWSSIPSLSLSRERSIGGPSNQHPNVSGLHLPRISAHMPPNQAHRYPGDGLDFRRPISLTRDDTRTSVIDLTADEPGPFITNNNADDPSQEQRPRQRTQRPPRFDREIIDLDDEDSLRPAAPAESPEVQFVSSRTLETPRLDPPRYHNGNLGGDDDDDLEIVDSRTVPRHPEQERLEQVMAIAGILEFEDFPRGQFLHLRQRIQRAVNARPPVAPPRGGRAARRGQGQGQGHIHVGFHAPPMMDFEMVGFDLGLGGGRPPPPPTYDAPQPAPEGFTRSPTEDVSYICPNCEDELCMGDVDIKRQVWIVKSCGHIYCGECATNRFSKKSLKGKEKIAPTKHKPFKQCVVEGCDKKTNTTKAMIQIFL